VSDHGPDATGGNDNDVLGIELNKPPKTMGEKRDYALDMVKQAMMDTKRKAVGHVNPMIRGAVLAAYMDGLTDMQAVFAQIVETPTEEELQPG